MARYRIDAETTAWVHCEVEAESEEKARAYAAAARRSVWWFDDYCYTTPVNIVAVNRIGARANVAAAG
jgi:hypothetical protein